VFAIRIHSGVDEFSDQLGAALVEVDDIDIDVVLAFEEVRGVENFVAGMPKDVGVASLVDGVIREKRLEMLARRRAGGFGRRRFEERHRLNDEDAFDLVGFADRLRVVAHLHIIGGCRVDAGRIDRVARNARRVDETGLERKQLQDPALLDHLVTKKRGKFWMRS